MTSLIRAAATAAVRLADWLLSSRPVPPVPADALWSLSGRDVSGPISIMLWPLPNGRLGMTVIADGQLRGLQLTREDVQQWRHAVTGWLVDVAPAVKR